MTAAGTVTRVIANGSIEVELAASARCRGCEGVCLWRRLPAQRAILGTQLRIDVGQPVIVALPERYVLLGALLLYAVPLAALLAGALAGVALIGSDVGGAVGAMLAVGATLLATPRLRRRLEQATLRQLVVRPREHADAATHSL